MTDHSAAAEAAVPADSTGLVERLMAAVRPEFRVKLYVVGIDDPILSTGEVCRVPACERAGVRCGLCGAHHSRWAIRGHPDLDGFVATTDPATQGHQPPSLCTVAGCRRGGGRKALCDGHHRAWHKAGRPALAEWLSTVAPVAAGDHEPCAVPDCVMGAEPRLPDSDRLLLCVVHLARWYRHGRPSLSQLAQRCATYGEPTVDFWRLPAQLRLEIQYGVQGRVDDRTVRLPARCLQRVIKFLAGSGARSLTVDRDRVNALLDEQLRVRSTERAFVHDTMQRLDDLVAATAWEGEYPRDRWRLARLGLDKSSSGQAVLRFDGIRPAWLRQLAKRHARLRLTTAVGPSQAAQDVLALTRLSEVLVEVGGEDVAIARLDREVIERYLALVGSQGRSDSFQRGHIAALMTFLHSVRRHGWAPDLPADAMVHFDDYPRTPALASRHLSEHVMHQIEDTTNLAAFDDPAMRVMTEILVRTGLRSGDARQLFIDCLIRDNDDAAYLRYTNHKLAPEPARRWNRHSPGDRT